MQTRELKKEAVNPCRRRAEYNQANREVRRSVERTNEAIVTDLQRTTKGSQQWGLEETLFLRPRNSPESIAFRTTSQRQRTEHHGPCKTTGKTGKHLKALLN
jgi:hypothetical protein